MFQPHAANRSSAPSNRRVSVRYANRNDPDEDRQRQHPQQRRQAVVLEHRHDGGSLLVVALRPPMTLGRTFAGRRRVPVTGARERRHQHVEPREAGAPAEVEILVPAVQTLVEQPDPLPRVARDQHGARRDAQHLDHPIELPLIDLARLQRRVRVTEPIRGATDLPQQPRLLPVHDLGSDDADVLHAHADRRLDETRHRIGVERGVVVQHQEVVRGPRRGDLERRADRSGETAVAVGGDDAPVAQRLPEQDPTSRRSMRRRPRPRPSAGRSARRAPTGIRGAIRRRPVRRGRPGPRARVQKGFRWTIQSCDALPRGAEPSRPGPRTSGRGAHRPPSHVGPTSAQRLRAAGLRAAVFLRAAGLRAAVFFRAAGLRRAAVFLRAAGLRAAVFFRAAGLRRAAVFLRAAGLRAAVFFRAAGFGEPRSSCELPASAPRSSSVRPASCEPRACERRSSCEPRACERPSSCERPACGPRSSCEPWSSWLLPCCPPFAFPVDLRRHTFQAPTLPFTHPAPHAVAFIAAEGVVEAFDPNGAFAADPFGLPR